MSLTKVVRDPTTKQYMGGSKRDTRDRVSAGGGKRGIKRERERERLAAS